MGQVIGININVGEKVEFDYVNHRGFRSVRRVEVMGVYYGSNKYHTETQFLMAAIDLETMEERHFAMSDITHLRRPRPKVSKEESIQIVIDKLEEEMAMTSDEQTTENLKRVVKTVRLLLND